MIEKKYVEEKDFFKIAEGNPGLGIGNHKIPMTPWVLVEFRVAKVPTVVGESSLDSINKALENQSQLQFEWVPVSTRKPKENWTPSMNLTEEIRKGGTLAFDNFFENMELDDDGGIINCNLKLFDRDYGNLEDIILQYY